MRVYLASGHTFDISEAKLTKNGDIIASSTTDISAIIAYLDIDLYILSPELLSISLVLYDSEWFAVFAFHEIPGKIDATSCVYSIPVENQLDIYKLNACL